MDNDAASVGLAAAPWEDAVCRKDILLALVSYLLIFGGIMAVFSYLATFLVRYTHFPAAYVTLVLALYGVADIVGNLAVAKRVPDPMESMFRRLLLILNLLVGSHFAIWRFGVVAALRGCSRRLLSRRCRIADRYRCLAPLGCERPVGGCL
jgi:predicted MFS family arabinose efflux permease